MSSYQVLFATLLVICRPGTIFSQEFGFLSADLQIDPQSVEVGSSILVSFNCTVTVTCENVTTGCIEDILNVTLMKNEMPPITGDYIFPTSPVNITASNNTEVNLSFVLVTNATPTLSEALSYSCAASSISSTVTSPTQNLTLTFPSDLITSVSLIPLYPIGIVGSFIELTCTSLLSVDVSGATIEFDYGFTSNSVPAAAGTNQTNTITISPVTISSAGKYTCTVTVTATGVCGGGGSEPACPTNTSDTVYLTVLSISPTTMTRLDIPNFNTFNLSCSLSVPTDSNLNVSFTWTEQSMPLPANTILSMSSVSTMSNSTTETSLLSVTLNPISPGATPTYTYECIATVNGSNSANVSAVIDVRGSAPPNQPLLGTVSIFPEKAVVQFTVSSVAYDPENYTIIFGESMSALTMVSDDFNSTDTTGSTFLTATNLTYTITVNGLIIFQKYYYLIVATNSNSSTNSSIGNFTTAEAAPGSPSNLSLRIDTATTLYLTWEVPEEPNGNITEYRYTCSNGTYLVQNDTGLSPSTRSAIIDGNLANGLAPFTRYTCSVFASTSAGEGMPATVTGTTASAVPSGPPQNFRGTPAHPNTLTLSWDPPLESSRNGEISNYTYWCLDVHTQNQTTLVLAVDVTGLEVFTVYTCLVYAVNVNGTGPAASTTARTAPGRPGIIRTLTVNGMGTQFRVEWLPPLEPNGEIENYFVLVYFTSSGTLAAERTVPENQLESTVTGLEMYIPYNVSVFAATSAGNGPSTNITAFTEEGRPEAVVISDLNRINGTHLEVTWERLTLEEARGFLTGYIVTAVPVGNMQRRQDNGVVSQTFPPSASSGILNNLTPGVEYSVSVAGSTVAGEGSTSSPSFVSTVTAPGSDAGVIIAVVIVSILVIGILVLVIVVLLYLYLRSHTNVLPRAHKRLEDVELKKLKQNEVQAFREPIPVDRFAQHVADFHSNKDLGFEEEYATFKYLPVGAHLVYKLPHNTSKNRFENVFPFDASRVRLTEADGEPGSDYINASWIDGYRREKAFIASQGPLVNTVSDFWRMVWEYKMPTIVMLTELMERGVNKCSYYWPKNIDETMDIGYDLKVTLVEQRAYVEYKLKKMTLINTSDEDGGKLEVTHYHFTAWPDHGVPADKTCMLAFIKRIRKIHPPTGPPLLVHCSAGVGRTGTFITLDTMLQRMKEEDDINIYEFVKQMRAKRVLMVQTEAQYIYIHDALAEFITCGDTSFQATSGVVYKRMQHLQSVSNHQSGFQHQFELLRQVSIKATEGHCTDALSAQNADKNRYKHLVNSLPFNYNRVHLKTVTGSGEYINASYVDGYKHRGAFLATQAPLESTVNDLWRMVWENQSKAIVMLCDVDEQPATDDAANEVKQSEEEQFPQYWPANPGEKSTYGKLVVKLLSEKQETFCTVRKMELSMDSTYINMLPKGEVSEEFVVTQYHYRNWPKSGKPSKPAQVVRLIDNLIKTQSNTGNNPITVMCSDGVGRTGAFICIYSVLERVKTEGVVDIFQFIKSSRFQRPGLVKELDQYIFCHEVLQEFLATFDNYANF